MTTEERTFWIDDLDEYFEFDTKPGYYLAVSLNRFDDSYWANHMSPIEQAVKAQYFLQRIEKNELTRYMEDENLRWSEKLIDNLKEMADKLKTLFDDDVLQDYRKGFLKLYDYVSVRLQNYAGEHTDIFVEMVLSAIGLPNMYVWHNMDLVRVYPFDWDNVLHYIDNKDRVIVKEVTIFYHHYAQDRDGYALTDFFTLRKGKLVRVIFSSKWFMELTLRLRDGVVAKAFAELQQEYPPVINQPIEKPEDVDKYHLPNEYCRGVAFRRIVNRSEDGTVTSFWVLQVPTD